MPEKWDQWYDAWDADWSDWNKFVDKEADSGMSLTLYCVYASEDTLLQAQLEKHLSPLLQMRLISQWYNRQIVAGTESSMQFDQYLEMASIILLLISPDFLASDYSYSTEIKRVLERHKQGEVRVTPIILRSCDWLVTPFASLQHLPRNGKAVTIWSNQDDAFADIAQSIRLICSEFIQLSTRQILQQSSHIPSQIYQLRDVFIKSGTPTITFVEPIDFEALKQSLAQPGRGIVIEGPSGVGKTTAVEKAIESLAKVEKTIMRFRKHRVTQKNRQWLSARNPDDRRRLQTLRKWHKDIVIIDDFHRLDLGLRQDLVDYLKYLADTSSKSQKLVILGIPRTGQTLVDTSFDISTRIDVFRFGYVPDELIFQMIEKGESALNILFDRKTEIVLAANGSLNIAQFLCFNLCQIARIGETSHQLQMVSSDLDRAQSLVTKDLSRKFSEPIRRFASMGGPRDSTSMQLLEALVTSEDGFLSLPHLKRRKPSLAYQLGRFLTENWMDQLYHECLECEQYFFFDRSIEALVIDDPQLAFYLKQLRFSRLAKEAGKVAMLVQRKVFISYSHKDARWLERLRIHLKPVERDGIVDLWDDTKIAVGIQWKEAILEALETSKVAVLIISADFLASDFIAEHELPTLLAQAESGGTAILPIIVSPCLFRKTALNAFQAVNSPDKPLSTLPVPEREQVFVNVAEAIMQHLANIGTKQQGSSEGTQ
jgi:TIR domain/ATPase family associated with various cellular activities (AAA)